MCDLIFSLLEFYRSNSVLPEDGMFITLCYPQCLDLKFLAWEMQSLIPMVDNSSDALSRHLSWIEGMFCLAGPHVKLPHTIKFSCSCFPRSVGVTYSIVLRLLGRKLHICLLSFFTSLCIDHPWCLASSLIGVLL